MFNSALVDFQITFLYDLMEHSLKMSLMLKWMQEGEKKTFSFHQSDETVLVPG